VNDATTMRPFTLVTGASSGIGRGIAVRLAASGRNLIISGRDQNRLKETCAASATCPIVWQYDLRDVRGVVGSLATLLKEHGAIVDTMVHSAGIVKIGPMRQMDPDLVNEVLAVNFHSAAEVVRGLLKRQLNHGALRNVVFISSTYGIRGATGQAIYSASKGALDAMMRSLAVELAPRVRVNSVVPGAVRTPMAEVALQNPDHMKEMMREHLLGVGTVEDVASAVEFLVSDTARWVPGQQLISDGGQTAH
jgi:NAD(P)-dependent dehydrogenase (short-subunit alcohol dehydrogenase family)